MTNQPTASGGQRHYRVAVIAGDGIGREVVPEGIARLGGGGRRFGFRFEWRRVRLELRDYYAKHRRMMPEDGLDQLRKHDAIFLGAVGYPGVPDHVSLWGLLIPLRRSFEQYANLRPVRLLAGISSPLAGRGAGRHRLLSSCARTTRANIPRSAAGSTRAPKRRWRCSESVFTRRGSTASCATPSSWRADAASRHLTSATKSNGIIHTMPFWDERFAAMPRPISGRARPTSTTSTS